MVPHLSRTAKIVAGGALALLVAGLVFMLACPPASASRYDALIQAMAQTQIIYVASAPMAEAQETVTDPDAIEHTLAVLASGWHLKQEYPSELAAQAEQPLFLILGPFGVEYALTESYFLSKTGQALLLTELENSCILWELGNGLRALAELPKGACDEIISILARSAGMPDFSVSPIMPQWQGYAYHSDDYKQCTDLGALLLSDQETLNFIEASFTRTDLSLAKWLGSIHEFCIQYGLPENDDNLQSCWYVRIDDASAWYTFSLPFHMVAPVLALCYGPDQDPLSPIRDAWAIQFTPGPASSIYAPRITDADLVVQAIEVLLLEGLSDHPSATGSVQHGATVSLYYDPFSYCQLLSYQNSQMSEQLLALAQKQAPRNAEVQQKEGQEIAAAILALRPEDLTDEAMDAYPLRSGIYDRKALVELLHSAMSDYGLPLQEDVTRMKLWSVYLPLKDGMVSVSAGTEEDAISIFYRNDSKDNLLAGELICNNCPELYWLLRNSITEGEISVADPAVLGILDRILQASLKSAQNPQFYNHESYLSVELTHARELASFENLLRDRLVRVYDYDYGYVMTDLKHAPWAGGPYADSQLRYHPHSYVCHLVTVEQNGLIEFYDTMEYEGTLDPEAFSRYSEEGDPYTTIANILCNSALPSAHTISIENIGSNQDIAEAFGQRLSDIYLTYGSAHPYAVTFAQFANADVYDEAPGTICARISIALNPVELNSIYWAAGSGLDLLEDGPLAGQYLHSQEYRLNLYDNGLWRCTEVATGGIRAA